jgi:hypothetical protein
VVIPLSSRVPGRASGPSRSRVDNDGGSRYVSGKLIGYLGFSRRGEYIGGGAMSGGGPGGLTTWWRGPGLGLTSWWRGPGLGLTSWWRGPGLGDATLWCGHPLAPLRLCFGLRLVSGKIGTSAFVSSDSENISCVTFLKHKNSKKQELALWHLVNRLVP